MVQGGSQAYISKTPCGDWDNSSRKEGFQALQKKEQDKKEAQKQQEKEKSKYGAWGSTYKNRDHFINLHHC